MRAIVFDFFGTLTDPAAELERQGAFGETAAALGVAPAAFWQVMTETFAERIIGRYGDTRATLHAVAKSAKGTEPTADQLDHALATHRRLAETLRRPRPGILDTLDELRGRGFRLGLISDCGSELVESWPSTPYAPRLDAAVFSWREGYRKPDPRLYATAAERLGVPAAECWFVGDGGSRELQGARAAGMRPVLVTNAGYAGVAALRDDPDAFRPELTVDDPAELPTLIGAGENARVGAGENARVGAGENASVNDAAYEPGWTATGATGR